MDTIVKTVCTYVANAAEAGSALVIAMGVVRAVFTVCINLKNRSLMLAEQLRGQFGSSVAIALELLLGADVLDTAVAPSWDEIGKLAAIAVLRTALNFFLDRELRHASK